MRVVFNRKSTNIKSDFNYFDTESVQEERDIFDHLKYNALYSGGGPYLSEKDFSAS